MNDDSSLYSMGQSSAAVAMANDAIANARRAAASSRMKRAASPSPPKYCAAITPASPASYFVNTPNLMGSTTKHGDNKMKDISSGRDLDLKHNDNSFHVIATLLTERLLPKIHASPEKTHYTMTTEDVAFFQKMLPYSMRRGFVDALRYRLQLMKMGVGSKGSELVELTMQCQKLGLERENLNVLFDLNLPPATSAGKSYPINFKCQVPVATTSPRAEYPYRPIHQSNHDDVRNDYDTSFVHRGDNGVNFGLHSPMAFSPAKEELSPSNGTFSPGSNNQHRENNPGNGELTVQSLARQQIMAEIKETRFLMSGSVTNDAVNFWKKHLEDLNQRLVVLTMGEQRNAMENGSCGGGGGGGIDNGPIIVTREEFREYGGSTGGVGGAGIPSQGGECGVGFYPVDQGSIINDTKNYVDGMTSASQIKQRDELPICEVVSPSDLPGGYMFEAQLGTKKFLATVPLGGVVRGERFVSTMRELENIQISVPLGSWRDFAMECFSAGIFHPMFCNTLFFPCIALGQIMTRTSLDWRGEPANRLVSSLSCANMTVLLSFWLAMNASAFIMLRVAWQRGYPTSSESYVPLILFNGFLWLYMVILTAKVRESIRNKYQIPEEACLGSEDCVCATFCMPCAICQMGRHTADYDTFRATCCNSTGLPTHVELAPVTFYQDQYQNMNDESQGAVV